jgi:hypothetical protein
MAAITGSVAAFSIPQAKFVWRSEVPNPREEEASELAKQVLSSSLGVVVSVGESAVHGWSSEGALLWSFAGAVKEVFFLTTVDLVVLTADKLVHVLDPLTGTSKQMVAASPKALRFSCVYNLEDKTMDLVQSFNDGKITVTPFGKTKAKTQFWGFTDGEFGLFQDDGFLVFKKTDNVKQAVVVHINSGGEVGKYSFSEPIKSLRSEAASRSVFLQGGNNQVVLRVVDDKIQVDILK